MKTKTSQRFMLLTTDDSLNEPGQPYWSSNGTIYETEEAVIGALLQLDDAYYKHAKMVGFFLPTIVLPDDFEKLIGTEYIPQ